MNVPLGRVTMMSSFAALPSVDVGAVVTMLIDAGSPVISPEIVDDLEPSALTNSNAPVVPWVVTNEAVQVAPRGESSVNVAVAGCGSPPLQGFIITRSLLVWSAPLHLIYPSVAVETVFV